MLIYTDGGFKRVLTREEAEPIRNQPDSEQAMALVFSQPPAWYEPAEEASGVYYFSLMHPAGPLGNRDNWVRM